MVLAPATLTCCPRTARARPSNGSRSCGSRIPDRRRTMPARIGSRRASRRKRSRSASRSSMRLTAAASVSGASVGRDVTISSRSPRNRAVSGSTAASAIVSMTGLPFNRTDRRYSFPPTASSEGTVRAARNPSTQAKSKSRGSGTRTPASTELGITGNYQGCTDARPDSRHVIPRSARDEGSCSMSS